MPLSVGSLTIALTAIRKEAEVMTPNQSKLGVCQWFHYEDDRSLELAVELLQELGVRHLRTGISWADYHRPGGKAWYDRQAAALAPFDVLLSVWHTPPSRSEGNTCASPPRRLADYGDFIEQVIIEYGDSFSVLELWNEPNNRYKWDFPTFDPDWSKFGEMIRIAGERVRRRGRKSILGGMAPVDPHWLRLMQRYGALEHLDGIAIHGFPEMWWANDICWEWYTHWSGWKDKIDSITNFTGKRPVWITETGLATWDAGEQRESHLKLQCAMLEQAASAPAARVYWYSLIDLDPSREAIEGFHVDENEYHMGLVRADGTRKPAFDLFQTLLTADSATDSQIAFEETQPHCGASPMSSR